MNQWTTAADLRSQVQRLWDRGRLLACVVDSADMFPLRLVLRGPSSSDLSDRFDEVRTWSQALQQGAKSGYRVVLREVKHRVIGTNVLPDEAWVDTLDDALRVIGKRGEGRSFDTLIAQTRSSELPLMPWLQANSLRALALAGDWPRLLDVLAWMRACPRPGIYLRQVDLPGIHSKFIEEHRAVLSELLDLVLPADAVDMSVSGVANFARRYGFRGKPVRVRWRMLDPHQALLGTGTVEDIAVNHEAFAQLNPLATRVFITENEINFLAFPPMADSMVIFGAGYGFDMLAQAGWLQHKTIHYWGDIDTHGFAILNELRGHFAHLESFLMDRETLLAHQPQWTDEQQPTLRDLPRLDQAERALFDDLRWKRLSERQVRLEQERIGFRWMQEALETLRCSPST